MKIKRIKDNEVVIDGKEHAKLLCYENAFKPMQRRILDGKLPRFTTQDGYYGDYIVSMDLNNFPIHPTPNGSGLSWEIFRKKLE